MVMCGLVAWHLPLSCRSSHSRVNSTDGSTSSVPASRGSRLSNSVKAASFPADVNCSLLFNNIQIIRMQQSRKDGKLTSRYGTPETRYKDLSAIYDELFPLDSDGEASVAFLAG